MMEEWGPEEGYDTDTNVVQKWFAWILGWLGVIVLFILLLSLARSK